MEERCVGGRIIITYLAIMRRRMTALSGHTPFLF